MTVQTYQDTDWETIRIERRKALEAVAEAANKYMDATSGLSFYDETTAYDNLDNALAKLIELDRSDEQRKDDE